MQSQSPAVRSARGVFLTDRRRPVIECPLSSPDRAPVHMMTSRAMVPEPHLDFLSADPSLADLDGCKIQIDTAPGVVFMVYLDKTAENVVGKEGICRTAYDALLTGREVTLHEEFGCLTEITSPCNQSHWARKNMKTHRAK